MPRSGGCASQRGLLGEGGSGLGSAGVWRPLRWRRHPDGVNEDQGIYRGEVLVIMGVLADIETDTTEIPAILHGYDEDGDEEEMDS